MHVKDIRNPSPTRAKGVEKMEAKDTVMTIPQLQHLWGNENWQYITSTMTDFFGVVAEAQAEISFKAGIMEVVKWGLETCPHDLFGEGTQCYKRACDECWQEKWGILAP